MAYVPVPKDLTQVKTKLVLNLTKRQLIFFSLAAVVGVPFYFLTRKGLGSSMYQALKELLYMEFRRYLYRRKANVTAQSILLAIGYNINKLHHKIQAGRTGRHLFPLKQTA